MRISIEPVNLKIVDLEGTATSGDGGLRQSLAEAKALLSREDQVALDLHYGKRLSVLEIANELGIGRATVQVRLSRARRRLRDGLAPTDQVIDNFDAQIRDWIDGQ